MSEWSEDNFLERLAQSAAERTSTGICPKADDVSANVDSGGLKAISDELRQHMQHCPACSDLQRRLTLFEQASGSETSPDTLEAEGRLGAWLRGFLASQDLRRQVLAAPPPKGVELAFTPKRRPFWQMQWALAAAAAIVLAAGLIYFRRQAMVLQPRQEVAHNPPQPQSSLVLDSRSPSNSATARDRQAKDSAAKPSLTHQSTKVSSPRPVSPTEAPGPPSSEQRSQQVVAQTTPQTEGTRDETPRTVSTSPAPTAKPARVALSRQPTPVPGAGSTPQRIAAAPLSAPQRVGLPVGSRIWLKLDSVMPDTQGDFQFQATLLLPVTDSGKTLFDKGAGVVGVGHTSGGKTSVRIIEIASHGRRFKPASSPSTGLSAPVSGNTLSFASGQVLEMWLKSAVTFEAEGSPSNNPQK